MPRSEKRFNAYCADCDTIANGTLAHLLDTGWQPFDAITGSWWCPLHAPAPDLPFLWRQHLPQAWPLEWDWRQVAEYARRPFPPIPVTRDQDPPAAPTLFEGVAA